MYECLAEVHGTTRLLQWHESAWSRQQASIYHQWNYIRGRMGDNAQMFLPLLPFIPLINVFYITQLSGQTLYEQAHAWCFEIL